MPNQLRQGLTGFVEQVAGGGIDREPDLVVRAGRVAALDLHDHRLVACCGYMQQGQAAEPLHKGHGGGDRTGGIEMQAFRADTEGDRIASPNRAGFQPEPQSASRRASTPMLHRHQPGQPWPPSGSCAENR